ncbi:uncharacterized protein BDZ99DRAFT_449574, partial [Mytilinidion resinicola]
MAYYPPSALIPIYALFLSIGIILTTLRIFIRFYHNIAPNQYRNSFSLDDFFILIGLIVVSTCTAIQFYNITHGTAGGAVSNATKKEAIIVEWKVEYAMMAIEKVAFGAIKLSLLFYYNRIFWSYQSFNKINNMLISLVALWTVAFVLADLLLCGKDIELNFALDQTVSQEKCGDKGMVLVMFAATSVLTDVLVVGLPLPYIRKLKLERRKKRAVYFVFLLGGISTLAGLLRLIFLCVAYQLGRLKRDYRAPPEAKTPRVLQAIQPTFWVMMEMLIGLWAANL